MAVNEILLSFSDNLKKARNPFFGTFIVVWIIRNWKLLVTLFNLDLYPTVDEKIEVLQSYFVDGTIVESFLLTSLISLVVLIVTYVLLNVTRFISNSFEKKVTPWVYKITDKTSIVLKIDYNKLEDDVRRLEERLSEERLKRLEAERERDSLESLKREQVEKLARYDAEDTKPDDLEAIDSFLLEQKLTDKFLDVVASIKSQKALVNSSSLVHSFLRLGLIELDPELGSVDSTSGYFRLTMKGHDYWDYRVKQNIRKPHKQTQHG